MRVYFSTNKNKKIVTLPYVPEDAIDITLPTRNIEEVGSHRVLGGYKAAAFSVSYDYPKSYKLGKNLTADKFIKWAQDCIRDKKIVRVVAVKNNGYTFFNRQCLIEELTKKLPKRNGDIPITIKFKER